ncbi:phage tail protein [Capnocytophaga cynodegmi]|uniref:phage tail protein n=1 Tax=Capnocytophaga cynodegmi TaxID=28189 RepID=UPI0037D0C2EF
MKYIIKRNNTTIATIRPEGQLQAGVMGEETVTMAFSLANYIHFQTGDTVEVYGNTYYLATEPQVEKISSREFRYSLEFQGIKYELGKVQYLFPDKDNVLSLSEFHIMGNARTMLDLLVQNANRTGQGWTLGTVDETEAKQLNFSAENCLAVLSKIAQEFKLEYWVDGDKSIHLTERKAVSGYSFEYGKAKGLKSLTRQTLDGSNVVTRLYAFGSEKNIAGDYRGGQQKLRMPVPYLEKNTNIYGIIEGSQTFDVFPHRLGTITAINPSNPLQFSDSGMDFDLNVRENGNTKYLINGVPVKVTFNTGQLAGYTFEVKQYGYDSATKTFTLLKNQDEKAIEVPSQSMRPAVGDRYVLTDLIMPESYITNAERELQQKAQAYLDENSRQRVVYAMVTDPLYFKAQNVNIVLGSTIRAVDTDFNLDDNLRVIRLTKDLQNPYNVQFEVAERAEIAYIVREYFEAEKAKTALVQADKFNAEMARRAYRFGKEISENVFDGEGYFNTEKIKPLSIETKLLSVGSRMQQFALPDVVISVENTTTVRNTQGKIVHLTLEEHPREWQIPANTQTGISAGFNYVYIKAQRIGSNASVFVSPEKIAVDSNVAFYHFEAGYLGSVENGQRRIRMSHGFTQINPFEITTGRIAPPSGNHYIELLQDRINIVGNLHITDGNINQIKQSISPDLLSLENRLKAFSEQKVNELQVGGRNYFQQSFEFIKAWVNRSSVISLYYDSALFAVPVQPNTTYTISGNLLGTTLCRTGYITGSTIVGATVLAPDRTTVFPRTLTTGENATHIIIQVDQGKANEIKKTLKVEKGTKATDLSPAPEDLQTQITTEQQARQQAINQAKQATENYIHQQSELTKQLAIAHADGKVSEAEQRQIANATQKLQEAKTYAEQKVNELQIGGVNILRGTKEFIIKTEENHLMSPWGGSGEIVSEHFNSNAVRKINSNWQGFRANITSIINKPVMISFWARTNSGGKFGNFALGNDPATNHLPQYMQLSNNGSLISDGQWHRYTMFNPKGMNFGKNVNNGFLEFHQVTGDIFVSSLQIEIGTKVTDWSLNPQDIDKHISDVRTDLETALKNARELLEAEDRNIKKITQKLEQKTDFINGTKINGNTVATGAVMVGNSFGGNAGINGSGASTTDVRFWAGSSFANRANASFRVLDNGKLYATNAEISGTIIAERGIFKGAIASPFTAVRADYDFGGFWQPSNVTGWNLVAPILGEKEVNLPQGNQHNGAILKVFGGTNSQFTGRLVIKSINNPIYVTNNQRQSSITTQKGKFYEFINILGDWYLIMEKQF